MQQTFQDRLKLDQTQSRWMNEYANLYCGAQHKLYAEIAKGKSAAEIKPEFSRENGLTSRQFNAMSIELGGKIDSTIELLKLNKQDIKDNIKKIGKAISSAAKSLKEKAKALITSNENKVGFTEEQKKENSAVIEKKMEKLKKKHFFKKRRQVILKNKLKKVETRLQAPVPGICFGSRKLFNQQFHLEQTDFGKGEEGFKKWKKAWDHARSHQFFLIGSKDETSGNQSCQVVVVHAPPTTEIAAPSTLTLTIRMPNALIKKGAPKCMAIEGVRFEYGQDQIQKILRENAVSKSENKTALSYRFHKDDNTSTGWRVFVSTDVDDAKIISVGADLGVLGVDFNADHLAWAKTDRNGNVTAFDKIDIQTHGKSTEQREAILSNALDEVFDLSKKSGCPIAIEDLDFAKKKSELSKMGEKKARMLSGLAYSKFRQLAESKASRKGIELKVVDPAYTSVAGSVKYAVRLGCTVHQAAAGVIARRAQGYLEKLPRASLDGKVTIKAPLMGNVAVITLPAKESGEKTGITWAGIRRCLTRHCADLVRQRKLSSSRSSTGPPMNSNQINGSSDSLRESVKPFDRRCTPTEFEDVPY